MAGFDIPFIRQALDGLAQRQAAIANNIANVDTPGYQRASVNFEALLRDQLSQQQAAAGRLRLGAGPAAGALLRTDPRHLDPAGGFGSAGIRDQLARGLANLDPNIITGGSRNDGNTVEMDREMVDLATTQVQYAGLTAALSARLRTLRSIIENG